MSIFFNSSDFNSSQKTVKGGINLSNLILTGPMTSQGISNTSYDITSSSNVMLTGNSQISISSNALNNRVLTCNDSLGNASWVTQATQYNGSSNTTTIQGETFTEGITNSINPINSSQNINLARAARLKYPSGLSGQVLTSDSTGLLSLQYPRKGQNYIEGVFTTGNFTFDPVNNKTTIGSLTFTSGGLWLVQYRFGFENRGPMPMQFFSGGSCRLEESNNTIVPGSIREDDFLTTTISETSSGGINIRYLGSHYFILNLGSTLKDDYICALILSIKTQHPSPVVIRTFGFSQCYATKLN